MNKLEFITQMKKIARMYYEGLIPRNELSYRRLSAVYYYRQYLLEILL